MLPNQYYTAASSAPDKLAKWPGTLIKYLGVDDYQKQEYFFCPKRLKIRDVANSGNDNYPGYGVMQISFGQYINILKQRKSNMDVCIVR